MYTGHMAIGLVVKALMPHIPTFSIIMGVTWLDLLDGIFVILGWNKVTPNPQAGPYLFFDLTFVDWDHSLLMAVILSIIWALLFYRHNKQAAIVVGFASFSHWIADWPMHNPDLALYPFSEVHFGFGLWEKLGVASWILEGLFCVACCAASASLNAKRGVNWRSAYILLAILTLSQSPWTAPARYVAMLPRPTADVVLGLLITVGFAVPGVLLCRLIDSAESLRKTHRFM
jgi:hypothetical protein